MDDQGELKWACLSVGMEGGAEITHAFTYVDGCVRTDL